MHQLSHGEHCVGELVDEEHTDLSLTSQRLRLLRAERLVVRRRSGKHVYYALADQHVIDLIRTMLDHVSEGADGRSTHRHEEHTQQSHRRNS